MLACLFAVTYLLSLFSSFVSNSCAAGFKYFDLRKMDQRCLEFLLAFLYGFRYLPVNTW